MLHLFKKVYIEVDSKVDMNVDRVIISENYGIQIASELEGIIVPGVCLAYGKNLTEVLAGGTLEDLFFIINERVSTTDKPVVIYADKAAFVPIVAAWYKTILKNASVGDVYSLLKSYMFKEQMFAGSRLGSPQVGSGTVNDFQITDVEFSAAYTVAEKFTSPALLADITSSLSIEFYLASYLGNGSRKVELKKGLRPLVAKDIEKYLYELKEILLIQAQRESFLLRLGATSPYTFGNVHNIVSEQAPYVKVMFDPTIWNNQGMALPTSRGSINLASMTDAQIENIRGFATAASNEWGGDSMNTFIRYDIAKLNIISAFRDVEFSDIALETIVNFEVNNSQSAGSFYAIDVATINNYLIDFIFKSYKTGDTATLLKYSV